MYQLYHRCCKILHTPCIEIISDVEMRGVSISCKNKLFFPPKKIGTPRTPVTISPGRYKANTMIVEEINQLAGAPRCGIKVGAAPLLYCNPNFLFSV